MKTFKHIKNFLAAIGSALVGCTERGEILPYPLHDEYNGLMTPRMETDAEYATRVHRINEHRVMNTILNHAPNLSHRQVIAIADELYPLSDDIKNLTNEELLKELNQ